MKRFFSVILLFCLLLPACAQADALYDWNISCPWKMRRAETVYSGGEVKRAKDTIPAGTYVKISVLGEEYVSIDYRTASGSGFGWVKRTSVMSAKIFYTADNGERHAKHELLYNGEGTPDEVQGYSPVSLGYHPGWKYVQNPDGSITPLPGTETPETGSPEGGSSGSSSGGTGGSSGTSSGGGNKPASSGSTKKKTEETVTITYRSEETVKMVQAGSAQCQVEIQGEKKWVPAGDVTFPSTAPEERRFAVIHAPKTGKATLRKKASASSAMVKNCKAGRVALVLEEGKTFTKVLYKDAVGYVRSDALRFVSAVKEGSKALLAYNGRTNGSTTINIRLTEGGRIIGDFFTGTEVTVIRPGEKWTEIEVQGHRGYVMNKYLLMEAGEEAE